MEEIAHNIFIESSYPGVVLGVLKLKHGVMMVDAPFRSQDQQSWQARVVNLGGGVDKVLVMLDTHIDRTLGISAMEANVLGHENSVEIIRERPTTVRGQDIDVGADWETYDPPVTIRWVAPNMTYTDKVFINWDDGPIVLSHQPGAHFAGSWLQYDAEKIIFVGDSLVINQPPFLAWADLDQWLKELAWLESDIFKGYQIVGGRNGLISATSIEQMIEFLEKTKENVDDLVAEDHLTDKISAVVPDLLKTLTFDKSLAEFYENRLSWGLKQYIKRHYPQINQETLGGDQ